MRKNMEATARRQRSRGRALFMEILLCAAFVAAACSGGAESMIDADAGLRKEGRHVFLILIDTLRADRLGASRGGVELMPNLSSFAEEALRFDRAISLSAWTKPSTTTLLTSLSPAHHGVYRHNSVLPERYVTLAEIMKSHGFETRGLSANFNISSRFQMHQGFDRFRLASRETVRRSRSRRMARRIANAIEPDEDQFFYLHLIGPHGPYVPPRRARRRLGVSPMPRVDRRQMRGWTGSWYRFDSSTEVEHLEALYDAEVFDEDAALAPLFRAIDSSGIEDSAYVVVTSDHGEAFGEHGKVAHEHTTFAEETRVPLVMRGPGIEPGVRNDVVSLLDVGPTLLSAMGLEVPERFEGVDLLRTVDPHRIHVLREAPAHRGDPGWSAVVRGDEKLVWDDAGSYAALHRNWWEGEQLTNTVVPDELATVVAFRQLYERMERRGEGTGESVRLDEDDRAALRALGYIE